MPAHADNLIWIDLEMTGLDTDHDQIIEIATVVTDRHLKVLADGPVFAIHQPEAILAGMDDWNTAQHGKSGLIDRVRTSTTTCSAAESATIRFLREWVPEGVSPMCGNSICQDRRFLYRQMPGLEAYFHYRHVDVSTVKELAKRWSPEKVDGFAKSGEHLALSDIYDSIEELRFYREHFFKLD